MFVGERGFATNQRDGDRGLNEPERGQDHSGQTRSCSRHDCREQHEPNGEKHERIASPQPCHQSHSTRFDYHIRHQPSLDVDPQLRRAERIRTRSAKR